MATDSPATAYARGARAEGLTRFQAFDAYQATGALIGFQRFAEAWDASLQPEPVDKEAVWRDDPFD